MLAVTISVAATQARTGAKKTDPTSDHRFAVQSTLRLYHSSE